MPLKENENRATEVALPSFQSILEAKIIDGIHLAVVQQTEQDAL